MANDLSAAFKQIEKQSKQMALNAMREVAEKARKMAVQTAKKCLVRYYKNYNPKRYKRTRQLQKAISFSKSPTQMHKGSTYSLSFYVKYDSKKLDGLYHSNSWYHQSGSEWNPVMHTWSPDYIKSGVRDTSIGQNNGVPESGWILSNYLQGIHPWAQTDSESTDTVMTRFFEKELPSMAGDMIYKEMQDAIVGFLKTYGGD